MKNPGPGKTQEGQKMPRPGLWVQKTPDLDPDPARSLLGYTFIFSSQGGLYE